MNALYHLDLGAHNMSTETKTKTKKKPEEHTMFVGRAVVKLERSSKRKPARITLAFPQGFIGHPEFEDLIDTLMGEAVGGFFAPVNIRGLTLTWADHTGIKD